MIIESAPNPSKGVTTLMAVGEDAVEAPKVANPVVHAAIGGAVWWAVATLLKSKNTHVWALLGAVGGGVMAYRRSR